MTLDEIMIFLEEHGSDQYRKILSNHGLTGPMFGVKVADMKKIQKKVKKNYDLSKRLFDTGVYDAKYLAGLIADEKSMTKADLESWMTNAGSKEIATYTVAWIAAESDFGLELARLWMASEDENTAAGGYSTYISLIATKANEDLDLDEISRILDHIVEVIHSERNYVRYKMNDFVISAGGYIDEMTEKALECGRLIGKVRVDMGDTSCKVPGIVPYIEKMKNKGVKKKKQARC